MATIDPVTGQVVPDEISPGNPEAVYGQEPSFMNQLLGTFNPLNAVMNPLPKPVVPGQAINPLTGEVGGPVIPPGTPVPGTNPADMSRTQAVPTGTPSDFVEGSDVVSPTKTGEQETTTKKPTEAFKLAEQKAAEAAILEDASLTAQSEAVELAGQAQMGADAEKAEQAAEFTTQQKLDDDEFNTMLEESRTIEADAKAEYDAFKFKDFWDDKGQGDKILSAMSIALGAFGASQTGGQNIGQILLTRKMDDFKERQKQELGKLAKGIDLAKGNTRDLIADYKFNMERSNARLAAAYDQIDKKFAVMATQAKTAETQAKIDQQRAQTQADAANKMMDNQRDLATITRIQKDVMGQNKIYQDPTLFKTTDGKDMSVDQNGKFAYSIQALPTVIALDKYEQMGVTSSDGYAQFRQAILTEAARNSNNITAFTNGIDQYLYGDEFQNLTKNRPMLLDYAKKLQNFAAEEIKRLSGAGVSDKERANTLARLMPISTMGFTDEEREKARKASTQERVNQITLNFKAANSPTRIKKSVLKEMGVRDQ